MNINAAAGQAGQDAPQGQQSAQQTVSGFGRSIIESEIARMGCGGLGGGGCTLGVSMKDGHQGLGNLGGKPDPVPPTSTADDT